MSWTVTSSSRNPGCPRLSDSSSTYLRPSSDGGGAAIGAAPRIRFHSSASVRSTMVAALSGDPTSRHIVPCCVRRFARARSDAVRTLPASAATPTSKAKRTSRGMTVGSAVGAKSASIQALKLERSSDPGPCSPTSVEKEPDGADRDGENEERKRHGEDDASGHERPPGSAERRAPSVEAGRGPRSPDPVVVPQLGAAVDRGEQRADRADAAAGDEVDLDARLRGARGARRRGRRRRCRCRSGRARCAVAASRRSGASGVTRGSTSSRPALSS